MHRPSCMGLLVLCPVLVFGLSGCASHVLAKLAVDAPNQRQQPRIVRDADFATRVNAVYQDTWRVRVGPPAAELAVAIIEPGHYNLQHRIERQERDGRVRLIPRLGWTPPDRSKPGLAEPRGTILLLHGYRDAKEDMLHWGLYLAECGFRSVLVDFRGHGQSSGDKIGFGAFEAADLSQVLDDLDSRSMVHGKLGVLGISYGASTALLLASRDTRVATVVALEPYSDGAKAVVEFAHGVAPQQAARFSPATFSAAVTRASRIGRFSWSDTNVITAMSRVSQPVLFYHGAKDTWLSPENSRALSAKAAAGSRLVVLEHDNHLILSFRLQPIAEEVEAWLIQQLIHTPEHVEATTGSPPEVPEPRPQKG